MFDNKNAYDEFEALLNDYLPDDEDTGKKVKGILSQIDRKLYLP